MKSYSFEKGKHGGPTGAIFPFFVDINGLLPVDTDYRDFCPAGFLKCRGQILQADQYPALASVLGVGAQCIYKKKDTNLDNANEDGSGGTFQLPDLGSKYITASSNSGQYVNDTTTDVANNEIRRAGVAVTLQSSGDEVDFSYTGQFAAPAVTLSFTGQWRYVQPPARSPETTLVISNFIAHGHYGEYAIGQRINVNEQGLRRCTWAGGTYCGQKGIETDGSKNAGLTYVAISYDDAGVEAAHSHGLGVATINVTGPSSTIPAVKLEANSITTTVKMRVRELRKMDDITPRFIIAEYLIKF